MGRAVISVAWQAPSAGQYRWANKDKAARAKCRPRCRLKRYSAGIEVSSSIMACKRYLKYYEVTLENASGKKCVIKILPLYMSAPRSEAIQFSETAPIGSIGNNKRD